MLLALMAYRVQALASCELALNDVFIAAANYRCVQVTITSSGGASALYEVTFARGNVYFNRFYDALVNIDYPQGFPQLSSSDIDCCNGEI